MGGGVEEWKREGRGRRVGIIRREWKRRKAREVGMKAGSKKKERKEQVLECKEKLDLALRKKQRNKNRKNKRESTKQTAG